MRGKLIGIGVGAGDPELMTIKAVKALKRCDILFVPDADKGESTAYRIAVKSCPEIEQKETVTVSMPMTHDIQKLNASHRVAADEVEAYLEDGKNVAFITLGDPTVYSTYMYVHKLVLDDGFGAEIISGIPSFCAAAARLNISLAERAEAMHIIPSSHGIEDALALPGTKILMKAGSKMQQVRRRLVDSDMSVCMVENCGMDNEKIYTSAEKIPEDAGYFSLIIAKDRRENK